MVVGWSELEHAEPELRRAHGPFRPGLGYSLVEPIFRLFAEAVPLHGRRDEEKLARYHRSRDALALELFDGEGRRIPTSAIHIVDYSNDGNAGRELDVLIPDDAYWARRSPLR